MQTKTTDPARQIVANLLYRKRLAKKRLARALATDKPRRNELVIEHFRSLLNEAHNAAEASRRILYRGVAAL